MLTITKLGGISNIVERIKPPHIDAKQRRTVIKMARKGDRVSIIAVSAGVITRAKINNVPTAGTATVITLAIITIKIIPKTVTGKPLARATLSSRELKGAV